MPKDSEAPVHYSHSTLTAADGTRLITYFWQPKTPKAVVILSHGYAEHVERYSAFAQQLADADYAVAGLDHRGHGKSEGERANIQVFRQYADDLVRFIEELWDPYPNIPFVLFGHSMGGVVASQLVLEHPHKVSGLILSSPYLVNAVPVSPLLVRLSGVLGQIVPSLPVVKLNTSGLSRDKVAVQAYENDPLVYTGAAKARLAAEMYAAGNYVLQRAAAITLPTLLLHGSADPIADVAGTEAFYRALGSENKTLKVFEGGYHELLNDLDKVQVAETVLNWLESHLEGFRNQSEAVDKGLA